MPDTAHALSPTGTSGPSIHPGGVALLQCTGCGQPLATAGGAVACTDCNITFSTNDGIIDFVASASATALDDIDYDQFYAISPESSLRLYQTIKSSAGPFWPRHFGNVLEVGCGTGGSSMAVLRQSEASNVVITDISTKMLRICRARINKLGRIRATSLTFASYSGIEDCIAPEAFDTCYGTSVVHHVTDVPRFLRHMYRSLKPGGRAFFMEPNAHFHHALTSTLAGILAASLRQPVIPEQDMSVMYNWMAEVHCNVVNSGDAEILADREDKHQFTAETFEAMAKDAGFTTAMSLPCHVDPTGWDAIRVYLDQCGVSEHALNVMRQLWPLAQRWYFASLKPRDRSPSYLFWLTKEGQQTSRPRAPVAPPRQAATAAQSASPAPLDLWLELAIQQTDDCLEIVAEGWCAAADRVKSVEMAFGGHKLHLPIWRPRPDVQIAINSGLVYPALHAICSGISGKVPLRDHDGADGPISVQVAIVAIDNRIIPVGAIDLMPNGGSEVLSKQIR